MSDISGGGLEIRSEPMNKTRAYLANQRKLIAQPTQIKIQDITKPEPKMKPELKIVPRNERVVQRSDSSSSETTKCSRTPTVTAKTWKKETDSGLGSSIGPYDAGE